MMKIDGHRVLPAGLVTKDEQYRSRYLVFTPVNQDTRHDNSQILTSGMSTMSSGHGTLLARFDVKLEDGFLKGYRRLKDGEDGENVWYAYMEISCRVPGGTIIRTWIR